MENIVENMHPLVSMSGGIELFAALITLVLLIGFLCSGSLNTSLGKSLIAVLICHLVMQASDSFLWFLCDTPQYLSVVKALNIISNVAWCLQFVAYNYCIVFYSPSAGKVHKKSARIMGVMGIITALVYFLNFHGMFYYYDEMGVFYNGEYLWVYRVLWYILLFANMLLIFCNRKRLKITNIIGFLSYGVFMIAALQLDNYWDVTPVYIASMVSVIWVCILIYKNQSMELQMKEEELSRKKIAIMLSQIQPHFLFNALLVIQELCSTNPKEAEKATVEFSKFLRGNLDSLSTDVPIPFEKEIEHTKNYLSLEQKRFGDKLRVEWEIQTSAFMIPALTLQPIVENAVRYGVTKRTEGGTVIISSRETEECYEVIVQDNGMGFDIHTPKEDGRTHIGISNVKTRLHDMCSGMLVIESTINVGTVATLKIPKAR